ncbi:hypothetical protein MPH_13200 [Macrophomina phaseolina MS6]|uniref:Uncharacterized protein n=1 Tax=Macrophomina phaseolina (strain MS6) TaxID=1126212 RepID=K2RA76_MACPH|nr:hypothetical protein MPH_13200 [Macrophomina phaseolina MS6]
MQTNFWVNISRKASNGNSSTNSIRRGPRSYWYINGQRYPVDDVGSASSATRTPTTTTPPTPVVTTSSVTRPITIGPTAGVVWSSTSSTASSSAIAARRFYDPVRDAWL